MFIFILPERMELFQYSSHYIIPFAVIDR